METPPPSYFEDATAQAASVKASLTPEQIVKLGNEIIQQAAKPETTEALIAELKDLGDQAVEVDDLFNSVSVDLGKVDQNDYKDKAGNPVEKLKPKWDQFHQEFKKIFRASRDSARHAAAYLQEFLQIVLPTIEAIKGPEDKAGRDVAIAVLKRFIDRKDPSGQTINLEELQTQAEDHSGDFFSLKTNIENFEGSFKDFANDQNATFITEIANAEASLKALNAQLTAMDGKVTALAIALGLTIFGTACLAVPAFAYGGPIGMAVVLVLGLGAIATEATFLSDAIGQANEKRKEVREANDKLIKLRHEQEVLSRLKALLNSEKEKITRICSKLNRFGKIWAAVSTQASLLHDALERLPEHKEEVPFNLSLNLVKSLYKPLFDGLVAYANHVNNTKVLGD